MFLANGILVHAPPTMCPPDTKKTTVVYGDETNALLGVNGRRSYVWETERRPLQQLLCLFLVVAIGLVSWHAGHEMRDHVADGRSERFGAKYAATQFISFTINTFGGMEANGECEGRDVDKTTGMCYLGNKDDLEEDVEHRMKILLEVLEALKADMKQNISDTVTNDEDNSMIRIDRREDVLKIFMVPEFFLRGPNGAYSMEELLDDGLLLSTAERLAQVIAVDDFEHFLFVFGTVIAHSTASTNNAPPYREWDVDQMEDEDVLYYNFAPIFKGGRYGRENQYIVGKRSISRIDFLNDNRVLPNPLAAKVEQYDELPDSFRDLLHRRHVRLIENNQMEIDGVRIGVEVCLDHKHGRLWETLQKESGQRHSDPELVDVQLITSAGMAIEFGPNPLRAGGAVYMTDGGATSAACWRPLDDTSDYDPDTVCRTPTPKGVKHYPPIPNERYSNFFTVSSCVDVLNRSALTGYYSLFQTQGCAMTLQDFGIAVMDEYRYYLPSIEFYPTVSLPPVATYR